MAQTEGVEVMHTAKLELDEALLALLKTTNQPVEKAATEMIVLELYRRHAISSGKAAEVLGMDRFDFIRRASDLGIPYFDMTDEELHGELDRLEQSQ
jgi:predicted HTH domain antitoxin